MFDFPSSFPPNAFGLSILETPDGWQVVIYRSVHIMLLCKDGIPINPETEYVVAATFHSLVRAIRYASSNQPQERYTEQWGDLS